MIDEKSHLEQGQIERARRIRESISKLEEGSPDNNASSKGKSLKEIIDERSREAAQHPETTDSE